MQTLINKQQYSAMRKRWWKIVCIVLLGYTFIAGLIFEVPQLPQLEETIRNLYFHVCMWFAMMILFTVSVIHAVKYLRTTNIRYDIYSRQFAAVGILFGVLGYTTGMVWMSYTWADPNNASFVSYGAVAKEPKLIGTGIALLIYLAYLILRDSIIDLDKKARISAVFNVLAFTLLFPTIWILPRLLPSLHPGREGNPALNTNDVDARMRMVFYPAILGWTLLGVWITSLKIRIVLVKERKLLNA